MLLLVLFIIAFIFHLLGVSSDTEWEGFLNRQTMLYTAQELQDSIYEHDRREEYRHREMLDSVQQIERNTKANAKKLSRSGHQQKRRVIKSKTGRVIYEEIFTDLQEGLL